MYVQFKRTEKCTAFGFLVGDRRILRFENELFFVMNSCNNHSFIFFLFQVSYVVRSYVQLNYGCNFPLLNIKYLIAVHSKILVINCGAYFLRRCQPLSNKTSLLSLGGTHFFQYEK